MDGNGLLVVIEMLGNTVAALRAQVQQLQEINAELEAKLKRNE